MSFLDAYKLPDNPFAPQQSGRAPRPSFTPPPPPGIDLSAPSLPPPEIPKETDAEYFAKLLASLGGEEPDRDMIWSALAKAERTMRSLPPLPEGYGRPEAPWGSSPSMTPTEGPDTGAPNPNAGGAPAGYFKRLAIPESGGDATARNKTTGAGGLFQILPTTWQGIMKAAPHLGLTTSGLYDPSPDGVAQQQRAADHYTSESMRRLVPALGRQPTMGELYALHFLGHGGGMSLLNGLDKPVGEVVSAAAIEANPWLKSYTKKPARTLLSRLEAMMG